MENDQTSKENALDRVLTELGLSVDKPSGSDEEAGSMYFLSSVDPTTELRQTKIVEKSLRWIRFLESQAQKLSSVAARLYATLAASDALPYIALIEAAGESRDGIIDRLEWTLAALEYWIEEQKPPDDRAQFRIRWDGAESVGFWAIANERLTKPTSLRAILRDAAEVEGEFPSELATRIAVLVANGLQSGEVTLLRVRRVRENSSDEETAFELLPRGEAYLKHIAAAEESTSIVPAEVEVELSEESAVPLAAFLDSASYASVTTDVSLAPGEPSFGTRLIEGVAQIAETCELRKDDVLRGLLFLANHQLEAAIRADDHDATARLGRAVRGLATVVLEERQT